MKQVIAFVLLFSCMLPSTGQTVVHNGAYIKIKNGAHIMVKGDYECKSNAQFSTSSIGFLNIDGNWINNSQSSYFIDNNIRVDLSNSQTEIKGSTPTNFPWLNFSGKGTVKLMVNLVVGGYKNKGTMGQLKLNETSLFLQGRSLILNNPNSNSLTYSTGGIVSETNSSTGYSQVQWNIRDGNGGPVFHIPLKNNNGDDISFQFIVNNAGLSYLDSGFVSIATYPTADLAVPNNRPLPLGVFHTDNECDGENSMRFANRYWIVQQGSYTMVPDITLNFKYADTDIKGSNDNINETFIGGIQWNASNNRWQYPLKGKIDPSINQFNYRAKQNFEGIWTLSDTTPYPKAQYTVQGECQRDSIVFTDISIDGTDKIIQRQWYFGDGGIDNGKKSIHYYQNAGPFNTQLIIRSQSGCQDTAQQRIMIQTAPTANFDLFDTCENAFVKTKSKSWPGAGFIESYRWNFGVGDPDQTGSEASYYYGAVGLPEIRLIVTNSRGCKDTAITNTFIAPRPFAFAQFENDCQYTPINFSNGSASGGGNLTAHSWNFGNGVRSNMGSEVVSYNEFGTFNITYAVENSYGCKDTQRTTIDIHPRAIASFEFTPEDPKMLKDIYFKSTSKYTDLWDWDFGDGYFATDEFPNHAYDNHGRYKVRLIANTLFNCADTTEKFIDVKSTPLYWFPNAFSPKTTEGKNDYFGIVTPLRIHEYNLRVYNRWGQQIFHATDPNIQWDGTVNGNLAPIGSYTYHTTFKSPENEIMTYKGTVMLLR